MAQFRQTANINEIAIYKGAAASFDWRERADPCDMADAVDAADALDESDGRGDLADSIPIAIVKRESFWRPLAE